MTLKTSEVPAQALRREASDLLGRIQYQHERVVITKHGKPIVAMVPIEDLALIESALKKSKSQGINMTKQLSLSFLLVAALSASGAESTIATIGAVHAPGLYGEAKCLNGVTFAADTAQGNALVEMDGVRFIGDAYPDRSSLRVLVKVTSMTMISKDGQEMTKDVDGYLQDKDGKPGLVADFTVTDNTLTLKLVKLPQGWRIADVADNDMPSLLTMLRRELRGKK